MIDPDELLMDYVMVRKSLEELKYDVDLLLEHAALMRIGLPKVAHNQLLKRLASARTALQWSKTLEEYGESCDDCD